MPDYNHHQVGVVYFFLIKPWAWIYGFDQRRTQNLTIFGQATIFAKMKTEPSFALLLCHHHRGSRTKDIDHRTSLGHVQSVIQPAMSSRQQRNPGRISFCSLVASAENCILVLVSLWSEGQAKMQPHTANQWCCWRFTLYGLRFIRFANSQSLQRRTTWLKLNPRHTMNSNLDHIISTRQRGFLCLCLVPPPCSLLSCPRLVSGNNN